MRSLRRTLLLGAALFAGGIGGAGAADLGAYGGGLKDYGYTPQMVSRSWYVRLDGGVAAHDRPFMTEGGVADLTETEMGSAWTIGGGLGYYFSKHVRGDLTYDHRFQSDISGYRYDIAQTLPPGTDCHSGPGVQSSCFGTREFGLKSDVFLANIYYDFDCRCHITPYLGLGLGFVHHRTSAGSVTNTGGVAGDIASASSTHVAAALMGGFSWQMRDRLALDAGYRFLYLGEAATGEVRDRASGIVIAPSTTIEQIHAHEFRLGVRYDIR